MVRSGRFQNRMSTVLGPPQKRLISMAKPQAMSVFLPRLGIKIQIQVRGQSALLVLMSKAVIILIIPVRKFGHPMARRLLTPAPMIISVGCTWVSFIPTLALQKN